VYGASTNWSGNLPGRGNVKSATSIGLGPVADELLSLVADAVITTDATGSIVLFNKSAEQIFGYQAEEVLGKRIETLLPVRLRAAHRMHVQKFSNPTSRPKRLMGRGREVVGRKKNGQEFPIEASLNRHTLDGRRLLTVVLRDITERQRVEEAKHLVTQEISHRLRNLMTVVDSVVSMTARAAKSVKSYESLLHERLGAIGRTVDLMLSDDWSGADLSAILEAELKPYQNAGGPTYRLSGPEVKIPPHWALSLTLALHELATNAAKYGAFSCPSGFVSIEWQYDPRPKGQMLQLNWVESGGPAVNPPDRQGFGTELVVRCVGRSRSHINYARTGLEAHFQVPL